MLLRLFQRKNKQVGENIEWQNRQMQKLVLKMNYGRQRMQCGNVSASDYRKIVVGLIFLKYVSDAFDFRYQELLNAEGLL